MSDYKPLLVKTKLRWQKAQEQESFLSPLYHSNLASSQHHTNEWDTLHLECTHQKYKVPLCEALNQNTL